jgi:hypothetical protein
MPDIKKGTDMRTVFLLPALCLVSCILLLDSGSVSADPIDIAFHVKPRFYAYNTEFFDPYRTGETLLGNSVSSWISFGQGDRILFDLGVYVNLLYGDDNIVTLCQPVIRLTWSVRDRFFFIFGNIDNSARHGMLDALQVETLEYTRQNEYGFQIKQKYRHFTQDSWVSWNSLDTPAHREYFDFGNRFTVPFLNFIFDLQAYISHHGGQLFHNGPTRDNFSLAAGLENFYFTGWDIVSGFGWKAWCLGSRDVPDRFVPSLTTTGYGILGEVYVAAGPLRAYCDYWKGFGFLTEEGNPFYRVNSDYVFWGLRGEKKIADNVGLSIELRMHSLVNLLEYEYRFEFKGLFDIRAGTAGTGTTVNPAGQK